MSTPNVVHQPRHRLLPFLTMGLAVVGLIFVIVTSYVWWPEPHSLRAMSKDIWDPMRDPKAMKLLGGAVVRIPVLCCALYVIVSQRYRDADKKWAYGAVGTLLGFWLGAGG